MDVKRDEKIGNTDSQLVIDRKTCKRTGWAPPDALRVSGSRILHLHIFIRKEIHSLLKPQVHQRLALPQGPTIREEYHEEHCEGLILLGVQCGTDLLFFIKFGLPGPTGTDTHHVLRDNGTSHVGVSALLRKSG